MTTLANEIAAAKARLEQLERQAAEEAARHRRELADALLAVAEDYADSDDAVAELLRAARQRLDDAAERRREAARRAAKTRQARRSSATDEPSSTVDDGAWDGSGDAL